MRRSFSLENRAIWLTGRQRRRDRSVATSRYDSRLTIFPLMVYLTVYVTPTRHAQVGRKSRISRNLLVSDASGIVSFLRPYSRFIRESKCTRAHRNFPHDARLQDMRGGRDSTKINVDRVKSTARARARYGSPIRHCGSRGRSAITCPPFIRLVTFRLSSSRVMRRCCCCCCCFSKRCGLKGSDGRTVEPRERIALNLATQSRDEGVFHTRKIFVE